MLKKKKLVIFILFLCCVMLFPSTKSYAENEFEAYITLMLTDAGDEQSLVGKEGNPIFDAEFTLYQLKKKKWKKVSTLATNTSGKVSFTVTKAGTYKIKQTALANGYAYENETPYQAEFTIEATDKFAKETLNLSALSTKNVREYQVSASQKTTLPITNVRKTGQVTIYDYSKTEAKEGDFPYLLYQKESRDGILGLLEAFITGKTYKVMGIDECKVSFDKDGHCIISNLPWGSYYIIRADKQGDEELDNVTCQFTLSNTTGTEAIVTFDTDGFPTYQSSLQVVTIDDSANTPLKGASYRLAGKFADGTLSYEWTGSLEGDILENKLIEGENYRLTQLKAPDGYQQVKKVITFTVDETGNLLSPEWEMTTINGNQLLIKNELIEQE